MLENVTHKDQTFTIHEYIHDAAMGTPWLFIDGFVMGDQQGMLNGVFGYRTADKCQIDNLYHEVAHALEFYLDSPERLVADRFDFKLPEQYVGNVRIVEPETTQAIERELRAFAIQAILMQSNLKIAFDLDAFIDQSARLMEYLPDWLNISILHTKCGPDHSLSDRDQRRAAWCAAQIRLQMKQYNIDQLIAIWPSVIARIIETSTSP